MWTTCIRKQTQRARGMTKIASTADAQGLRRGDIAVAMG